MDLILVITDGDQPANRAVNYAAHLAKRVQADILIASMVNLAGAPVNADADIDIDQPEAEVNDLQHPAIKYIIVAGDVYYGASSLMISPKFEQLLLNANAPVIVISEDMPVRYSEKFVFLTEISADDRDAIGQLCQLASISAASVMLTQVNAPRPLDKEQQFAWNAIMRDKITTIDYGRIYHYNIPDEIDKTDMEFVVKECGAEALALVYPQGGIAGDETLICGFKNALYGNLKVPLIIFPSSIAMNKM